MLKLTKIVKDYEVADTLVHALRGVDLNFRENEFVSILGPSGCGKTTMLNIIGGLDHATDGDLIINGRSTKEFKDRDWDVYRNHKVGFIFQSYNLIPHQTVLGNVELALTIAGMNKAERVAKAKAALDKVGLSDQYYKRPNQLSGGQCQRVAIARALVNNPEILLADEPTGALDSVTSVQIMELVKEIARERLVIMVTHNPELAEQYSTRIIRLLDGELLSDSNPLNDADEGVETALYNEKKAALEAEQENVSHETIETDDGPVQVKVFSKKQKPKKEKAKMSFWTAFKLSLQNLFSKRKRTILTAIAGSIGIIGVSMVLSISYGIQGFIDNMQNDMLSGNPIEIAQTAMNINSMMENMSTSDKVDALRKIDDTAWINSTIKNLYERAQNMSNLMVQNTINKDYVNYVKGIPSTDLAALHLDYGLDVAYSLYTDFAVTEAEKTAGNSVQTSLTGIRAIYASILGETQFKDYVSLISMVSASFEQLPNSEDYIRSQYTVNGRMAQNADEIVIVLGSDRNINDLLLAQLGYYSQEEFVNLIYKVGNDGTPDASYNSALYRDKISFDELYGKDFYWYKNDDIFTAQTGIMEGSYKYNSRFDGNNGYKLKVVGILEPKEDLNYGMLSSGFYYTSDFAEKVVAENYDSIIAKNLRNSDNTSYGSMEFIHPTFGHQFTGVYFDYEYTFEGKTTPAKALVGGSSTGDISGLLSMIMGGGGGGSTASGGVEILSTATLTLQDLGGNVETTVERDADGKLISSTVVLDRDGKAFFLPSRIAVYPLDLVHKSAVLKYLDKWDEDGDITVYDDFGEAKVLKKADREDVTYSDMMSLIMNMIKSLVDIITVALVGFTSLSLVVSCVMIAIITYVSVVERIKEIGVIRSLGGRKRDVSNLFTAETVIIGASSGILGIVVTYILSAILNAVLKGVIGLSIAVFPWHYALIMLAVSVGLTLISGLSPSRSAAKKDPVVALRSE